MRFLENSFLPSGRSLDFSRAGPDISIQGSTTVPQADVWFWGAQTGWESLRIEGNYSCPTHRTSLSTQELLSDLCVKHTADRMSREGKLVVMALKF